jgi:hypothetical protein
MVAFLEKVVAVFKRHAPAAAPMPATVSAPAHEHAHATQILWPLPPPIAVVPAVDDAAARAALLRVIDGTQSQYANAQWGSAGHRQRLEELEARRAEACAARGLPSDGSGVGVGVGGVVVVGGGGCNSC